MYVKHFASMYDGSMYGKGVHVFAVWGWVLSHTDRMGLVEINPEKLAHTLGRTTPEDITEAVEFLCSRDPRSRSKVEDGKRLIKTGEFSYRVVNYQYYRDLMRAEHRREYLAEAKRKERAKRVDSQHQSTDVNTSQQKSTMSTQAEAEAEAEAKNNKGLSEPETFAAWWAIYPKRAGGNPRAAAVKAYGGRLKEGVSPDDLLQGLRRYARYCEVAGKVGTEYIKQAQFWLGKTYRGWEESWDCPEQPMSEIGVFDG